MVPWSTVSIAGKPLFKLMEERPDTYGKLDLQKLADLGRGGGWTILHVKGYTAVSYTHLDVYKRQRQRQVLYHLQM